MAEPFKKPARSSAARLYLVDDEPLVRRGLTQLINLQADLLVCGDTADPSRALMQIQELQPDVAIVDLRLEHGNGLELIRQLHDQCPNVKVLVFTMHDEVLYAERALRAGAHGYVTKEDGSDRAIEAIQALLDGKPYLSRDIAAKLAARTTKTDAPGSA